MSDLSPPATDYDLPWDALVTKAVRHLQLQTTLQDRFMNLREAAWSVDLRAGTITFTHGAQEAVAPVQIVGTFNTTDSTWMWGWDHPSVPEDLGEHARAVRRYGERHHLEPLTTRVVSASEEQAWEFAAVADLLGRAQCAYRGPAGETLVFMTFDSPTLSRATDDSQIPEPAAAPARPGPALIGSDVFPRPRAMAPDAPLLRTASTSRGRRPPSQRSRRSLWSSPISARWSRSIASSPGSASLPPRRIDALPFRRNCARPSGGAPTASTRAVSLATTTATRSRR